MIFVGALLAATTGVVAASVISMGLISLPIMLRYGYDRRLASGVIAASGTLAQIIPPSLVLIIMADQLGRSVGDMYAGALIPGLVLAASTRSLWSPAHSKPGWAPALPAEARTFREPDGSSRQSLAFRAGADRHRDRRGLLDDLLRQVQPRFRDGRALVITTSVAVGVPSRRIVSKLLEARPAVDDRRAGHFVLIPPLPLIFLVLGTIFLGVATPTEGGAMGAVGAVMMAPRAGGCRCRGSAQAMKATAKLSTFVMFILIGARVFSLTFYGMNGHVWVEHLLSSLPGGQLGFLIFVNILVFVLAFFLDFFELLHHHSAARRRSREARHRPDLVRRAARGQHADVFMHPPFGFALFFLRRWRRPRTIRQVDRTHDIAGVTTGQIYWGAVPFVAIQCIMVGLIIAFPNIVASGLGTKAKIDIQNIRIETPSRRINTRCFDLWRKQRRTGRGHQGAGEGNGRRSRRRRRRPPMPRRKKPSGKKRSRRGADNQRRSCGR